jgi:hypothetical protein
MISVLGGSHFWNLELAGKHKFSALTRGSQNQSSCPQKKKESTGSKENKKRDQERRL